MKFTGKERKMYILALGLLVAAIALACTWTMWERPSSQTSLSAETPTPAPSETPAAEESPQSEATPAPEGTAVPVESAEPDAEVQSADAGTVDTVVYYQDNYGYLVPVQCKVPAEDGIAKATLSLMVKSTANDMQAARLGLRTVLPENISIDLDIADGLARIDLGKEALDMPDAAAESNMITAIVQALTEFPTVEKVEFLVGGQKLETLPHGTSVSGQFTREDLNPEMASADIALEDAEPVTLYFPGDASDVLVPVTRMVYSEPDINTAVVELCKGPSASSPLENVLPAGCGVIDVNVEDGVAKINFTGEFIDLAENSDGGRLALKALVLTCTQFDGIEGVEIYVDGEPYDPGADTLALPACANVAEEIVDSAIQTQSSLIFEFE